MNLLTLAIDAVTNAGNQILPLRPQAADSVSIKEDDSPVTKADLLSDRILKEALAPSGIPYISEESEGEANKRFWIADPLDGTKDFIAGSNDFCVMLALVENGVPILAVIYAPALGTLYMAEKGKGAYRHDTQGEHAIHVAEGGALIAASSVNHFTKDMENVAEKLGATIVRRGSNGIKGALVAEGTASYLFTPWNPSFWDIAAPSLLITEAGGMVSSLSGEPITYASSGKAPNGFVGASAVVLPTLIEAVSVLQRPSV